MSMLRLILALSACVALSFGCKTDDDTPQASLSESVQPAAAPAAPVFCKMDPILIESGKTLPSSDGCNTCSCDAQGGLACTEIYCPGAEPGPGCPLGPVLLAAGTSYKAADGCNTCVCGQDGDLACTEMACGARNGKKPAPSDLPTPEATCEVGPVRFGIGDSAPSIDGCNECICQDDGNGASFACTELACPDAPAPEGCPLDLVVLEKGLTYDSADGCNTCRCSADGTLSCTEMACN